MDDLYEHQKRAIEASNPQKMLNQYVVWNGKNANVYYGYIYSRRTYECSGVSILGLINQ